MNLKTVFCGRIWAALLVASLVSVGFWMAAAVANGSLEYWYLNWNLLLAWVPLVLTLGLRHLLVAKRWSSWPAVAVSLAWLFFLPNSFYVVTDFVHLYEVPRVDVVFDILMFSSFVVNGLILGFLSLYIVHTELLKRQQRRHAHWAVATVLLASSFAIYIGRDLRWNSWDVVLNPASMLFDISDRLLYAGAHPQVISITAGFFIFLSSVYFVIWTLASQRSKIEI